MATIQHDLSGVIAMLDQKIVELQHNMTAVRPDSQVWTEMGVKLAETKNARKILFDCCCGTQNCRWSPEPDSLSQA